MIKPQTISANKKLYGLNNYFNDFLKLYESKKFPKVILLSGKRGLGKFTLVYHFINHIFSKNTYDLENKLIDTNSQVYKDISNGIFENFTYLKNENLSRITIEEIRNLKKTLLKSNLNNDERFVVLDNVEKLNLNSSNALLKIIEEPSKNNYFILIDNQENKLLETIASRCFKINVYITRSERLSIIEKLINHYNIEELIDYKSFEITPGDFFNYNNICINDDIKPKFDYIFKINKLLNLYKKSKNKIYINMSIFITEQLFQKLSLNKKSDILLLNNMKINIIRNINDFVLYNLNLNSVTQSIISRFDYGK